MTLHLNHTCLILHPSENGFGQAYSLALNRPEMPLYRPQFPVINLLAAAGPLAFSLFSLYRSLLLST